jgi:glycosyltransferase involved in cell wall biosynthesis
MRTSICITTRNKAPFLDETLASIYKQAGDYEVIIVDDGSTDKTKSVCEKYKTRYDLKYAFLKNDHYRGQAVARNVSFKMAKGDILIIQTDDVIHKTTNMIQWLTDNLQVGEMLFAHVFNMDANDKRVETFFPVYCGPERPQPRFFLGTVWRRDVYAIGGQDEAFIYPGWEDDWFGDCLIKGLGLKPRYATEVVGWHRHHGYPDGALDKMEWCRQLYLKNCARGDWTNKPWIYT